MKHVDLCVFDFYISIMGLDLTPAAELGLQALSDLKHAVITAKQSAIHSATLAKQAFDSARLAEIVISDLARINPSIVGSKVARFVSETLHTSPKIELFSDPAKGYAEMRPGFIPLAKIKATPIFVQDMPVIPISQAQLGGLELVPLCPHVLPHRLQSECSIADFLSIQFVIANRCLKRLICT